MNEGNGRGICWNNGLEGVNFKDLVPLFTAQRTAMFEQVGYMYGQLQKKMLHAPFVLHILHKSEPLIILIAQSPIRTFLAEPMRCDDQL